MDQQTPQRGDANGEERRFFRRVLMLFGLIGLAYFFWMLAGTLLLIFAAILIAVILRAAVNTLENYLHVPGAVSFYLALVLVTLSLVGFGYFFGAQLKTQLADVISRLPDQIEGFAAQFGIDDPLREIERQLDNGIGANFFGQAAGFGYTILGGVIDMLIVIVAAIYLAYDPRLYRSVIASVFPRDQRHQINAAMLETGATLKMWFVGQMVSMLFVGLLSGIGYWAIGLPTPAALGLIAGITNFIPFIGPIFGAIPALVFGFNISVEMMIYALIVATIVQQTEGNVLVPLIQKRAVAMPPAMALFAIIIFGVLFGFLGILLAVPLAVTVMVMVRKLWIETVIEQPASGS
ncbi:MAG: AI-2E family transporter [Salinarimonas sp.]